MNSIAVAKHVRRLSDSGGLCSYQSEETQAPKNSNCRWGRDEEQRRSSPCAC
jgi:hypothetical protein